MSTITYLLWALINVAVFIGAFYLFIRYTSLINKRVGVFPALIFILGSLSMLSSASPTKNISDNTIFNETDNQGLSPHSKKFILLDNKLSKIIIGIQYQYDLSKTDITVLSAYTSVSGLIAGTKWESNGIQISKKDKNTFTYNVYGHYKWSILGIQVYTQYKYFEQDFTLE